MSTETQKILVGINNLQKSVKVLKIEVDYIREILEDSILTAEEVKLVDECIKKTKAGNKSDFVSLYKAKRE